MRLLFLTALAGFPTIAASQTSPVDLGESGYQASVGCPLECIVTMDIIKYQLQYGEFSPMELTAIRAGADAWNLGGATSIVEGDPVWPNELTQEGVRLNDRSVVMRIPKDAFLWRDIKNRRGNTPGEPLAVTMSTIAFGDYDRTVFEGEGCQIISSDIILRDTNPSTSQDQYDISLNETALSDTMSHEFGHALGMNHTRQVSTMGATTPHLQIGEGWTPQDGEGVGQYDYNTMIGIASIAGLKKPEKANLSLTRGLHPFGARTTYPVWRDPLPHEVLEVIGFDDAPEWEGCPDEVLRGNDRPLGIIAHVMGSSTGSPNIKWYMGETRDSCPMSEHLVGETTVTNSGVSSAENLRPAVWRVPDSVEHEQEYYLCAVIDPDGRIAETSEFDNIIVSNRKFRIKPEFGETINDPDACIFIAD